MDQVIFGGMDDLLLRDTDDTEYSSLCGGNDWSSTDINRQIISTSGTLKNLYIQLEKAPGHNDSYDFTIMVNGVATSLEVEIAGSFETEDSNTVNTVSVSAGDEVSIRYICTSGTAVSGNSAKWSVMFTGDTSNESLLLVTLTDFDDLDPGYINLQGYTSELNAADKARCIIPTAGTIKNLYIECQNDIEDGTITFELYKNDASTGLSVTISPGDTTGNDTSTTVSVTTEDEVYLRFDKTGFPAPTSSRVSIGMTFVATTDGESIATRITTTNPNNSYTTSIIRGEGIWWSPVEDQHILQGVGTIKKFYAWTDTAPGTGKSVELVVQHNDSDTNLAVLISDSETSGNDLVDTITPSNYDDINYTNYLTNSPSVGYYSMSLVYYIEPPAAATSTNEIYAVLSKLGKDMNISITKQGSDMYITPGTY